MRRSLISLLVIGGAAVTAAAVLLPWWLGLGLRIVGPHFGLSVQQYARQGYRHFVVRGVEYRRGPVRVTVEEVRATTPLLWLVQHWVGRPDVVYAGRWTTDVAPIAASERSTSPSGWVPLRARLNRIAEGLARWVPEARIGEGTVRWPNGGLTFGPVHWSGRTLTTPDLGYRALHAEVRAEFTRGGLIRVEARDAAHELTAALRSEDARVTGELGWAGQPAQLEAIFAPTGWRPPEAHLGSGQWRLPAERARLGDHYALITGHATVDWAKGALTAELQAEGAPRSGDRAPPIAVQLRAAGRDGGFVAEAIDVRLPGITARLSEPVTVDRTLRLRSGTSHFEFAARLEDQPWFPARGELRGGGRISPGADGLAVLDFTATGEGLIVAETRLAQFAATGRWAWPTLTFSQVRVRAADGRQLTAHGGWDFRRRELLDASLDGTIARETIARWLPAPLAFNTATITATAAGVWPELRHEGRGEVDRFVQTPLVPLHLNGRWKGRGTIIEEFSLGAIGDRVHIDAAGTGDLGGLRVTEATIRQEGRTTLQLAAPCAVRWRPQLVVDRARLVGGDTRLDVLLRWGVTGAIEVAAERLDADMLRGLVTLPAVPWSVETLHLQAAWDRAPIEFSADALLAVPLGAGRSAQVASRLHGDGDGIEIRELRVAEGTGVVVNASGRVPLVFRPGQSPFALLRADAPFALDASTTPNPDFWAKLTELSGVEIASPEAQVHLKGTLAQPRGEAELRAERVAPVPGRFAWSWPGIRDLSVRLAGDHDGVRLENLSVAIDGQTVRANGWVPVAASHWADWWRDPRELASHGDLHVEVPDADLSAIARYLPAYLAPTGRLQLDLTLHADQTLQGFVRIRDAASRPLGPLGVLQEVQADVRFEGRTVRLQEVTARMGGQQIQLRGRADLPAYESPRLDFTLQGENLPFVRRTGLLVRGDLDLTLKTLEDGPTEIGGEVRLRDSLFVADVRSLLPSGAKGTVVRPPYFAIDTPPLNAWRLAVRVHGERFMRLRTPVFNGTASADIRLAGVLSNPRATGQAVIDEGNIRLPFAGFEVRQGEVRLAPEQPEPQLLITGTTRRYGYDLRLELTGPASAPNLTFASSPPLEAEQVLLMVMAGQAPHNEVSTTDRQRMARFGAFFGQSLLGTLGGDSGGADRLTISSGENISAQGRETYSIEYKLNDRWALTGEYDEFDEYYGGVKWRFYQKGGRSAHAKE